MTETDKGAETAEETRETMTKSNKSNKQRRGDVCAVYGCSSNNNMTGEMSAISGRRIGFFGFPNFWKAPNNDLGDKWWTFCRRHDKPKPSRRNLICTDHFNPSQYIANGGRVAFCVSPTPVPSLFAPTEINKSVNCPTRHISSNITGREIDPISRRPAMPRRKIDSLEGPAFWEALVKGKVYIPKNWQQHHREDGMAEVFTKSRLVGSSFPPVVATDSVIVDKDLRCHLRANGVPLGPVLSVPNAKSLRTVCNLDFTTGLQICLPICPQDKPNGDVERIETDAEVVGNGEMEKESPAEVIEEERESVHSALTVPMDFDLLNSIPSDTLVVQVTHSSERRKKSSTPK